MIAAPFFTVLPRDVVKMVNLRHLRANLSTCKGVGKLTSLQELSSICVCKYDNIRELGYMQLLRGKLAIRDLENVEKLEDDVGTLMEKQTLMDELELVFNEKNSENTTISKKVLNALGCPPNLKCLNIIVGCRRLRAYTSWKQNVHEGNNIRELGDMQILGNNKKLEDAAGDLMEKQTLMDKLKLVFDPHLKQSTISDEEVLDALGCPPNLTFLRIAGYTGVKPPSWMVDGKHKFDKLQTLELCDCPKLKFLPPLGELTSLKHLLLWEVGVKRLGDEFYGKFTDGKVFFPSLESLTFDDMQEWEEWDIIIEKSRMSFFPCLTKLKIDTCPKLVSVLPVVKNPIMNAANFMTSLSSLEISYCDGLRSLPADGLPPSLTYLIINGCPQLQSLPADGLPPSLTHLEIVGCPLLYKLCKDESGPDWHKINHIPVKFIYP